MEAMDKESRLAPQLLVFSLLGRKSKGSWSVPWRELLLFVG